VEIEPMTMSDAWICSAPSFVDDRGSFLEWFRGDKLAEVTGRPFGVIQANHSVSRRGVVRGLHFADVPPGQAKYVYCPTGAVLDIVVDLRVGSPTFGAVDAVVLDDVLHKAVFISEGLGHAFCALRDDSSVSYLVSTAYDPLSERTITPVDPALALPWPTDIGPLVMSEKDVAGPTLASALSAGILPTMAACQARYASVR
jgi:dTDP-4-dehydrorhamnose 3,5-epimerase